MCSALSSILFNPHVKLYLSSCNLMLLEQIVLQYYDDSLDRQTNDPRPLAGGENYSFYKGISGKWSPIFILNFISLICKIIPL